MFLSIVIPVYNTAPYLADCLGSCLDQDLSPQDYEIICIDDGSTDGSLSVLQDFAARDTRVRVIAQENAGVSEARNAGIRAAQGDYIWFVDSDDLIVSNCLGELKEKCLETDCDRLTFSMIEVPHELPSKERLAEMIRSDTAKKHTQEKGFVCLSFSKREFLLSHAIFFPANISYGEDMIVNYSWRLYSHKFESTDVCCYYYRNRPTSAMGVLAVSKGARIKRAYSVINILLWLRENGMKVEKEQFNDYMALKYAKWVRILICELLIKLPRKAIRKFWKEIKKNDLLNPNYFYSRTKSGELVKDPGAPRSIYFEYFKETCKFLKKHPRRFLLGK